MKPVFLDTSGLIALTDIDDMWHARAVKVWKELLSGKRRLIIPIAERQKLGDDGLY